MRIEIDKAVKIIFGTNLLACWRVVVRVVVGAGCIAVIAIIAIRCIAVPKTVTVTTNYNH